MREIIDFHVHPFTEEKENMCFYKEGLSFADGRFEKDLKACGITKICGSVIEDGGTDMGEGFEALRRLNRHALRLSEQWGPFYIPGVHVHPDYVRESCEEIEYMHARGVRLVGELVPYMQGWSDYSSKALGEILDVIASYEMVVSFHSMDDVEMEEMIRNHPNVTFVAAHPNDKQKYLLHLERMRKYKNAYLDLSGTGLFRYGMLKYGVDRVGAEKFLFGTDYPITNPHMYVQAVEFEPIREEERELIFSGNAKRILGLTNE